MRPLLPKALDAHAVMPLACAHSDHLSCRNQSDYTQNELGTLRCPCLDELISFLPMILVKAVLSDLEFTYAVSETRL